MPTIICPNCYQPYDVDDNVIGEKVECAVCNTAFVAQLTENSGNQEPSAPAERITNDSFPVVEKEVVEQVSCPHCKNLNRSGTKFCTFCGKIIDTRKNCPFCNNVLVHGAVFCQACGKKIDEGSNNTTTSKTDFSNGLVARFNALTKTEKIVFVSALVLAVILFVFWCSLGSDNNESNNSAHQATSGRNYSSESDSSLAERRQAEAEMSMLLQLMGAAQQQSQGASYNSMPRVCTACGGLGYRTTGLGIRESCFVCNGTGYAPANNPWNTVPYR